MYVITPGCCADASCVSVCPVDCIHPTPDEPDFTTATTLYVDPAKCIDCGACADACPVDAIAPADTLTGPDTRWIETNREFYRDRPPADADRLSFPVALPAHVPQLRVAVVGTGPAAQYTGDLLLRLAGAKVTLIDRLPVPGGLLRYGVAPDHPKTRLIGDRFTNLLTNPNLRLLLDVEIGRDITVAELSDYFDAVVYAVGAATSRDLGIPGETLPGSMSATDFVAWYNGHPDVADEPAGLTRHDRAVLIGNGNVALDVARILTGGEVLGATDIADRALAALAGSSVREVVISARRGPEFASYTAGELAALQHRADVELVVAAGPGVVEAIISGAGQAALLRDVPVREIDWTAPPPPGKRIVLQFGCVPTRIEGRDHVATVSFQRADAEVCIETGLVIRAIGYHGRPVAGLPFDDDTGTIPNDAGRVEPGTYVVGWIKRGANGGIGANRQDATETVVTLMTDAAGGRLAPRRHRTRGLLRLLATRGVQPLDATAARAIDTAERQGGAAAGRPRIKFQTREELRTAARR